ncbi:hypothetical protein Sgleb_13120 [Streptomyces glebosus]|uniref:Uncharacterized protein n=1 Tax=Streptomyces glebosus TaxID=249580 RepID=A0A640SUQ1_9ACTN|nr:hypothetical protein Sgleb_13120 [Streptomyces glebosus]GHG66719.1 hypothetical protein GCM10010513_36200 [Streptomyces glebosus]
MAHLRRRIALLAGAILLAGAGAVGAASAMAPTAAPSAPVTHSVTVPRGSDPADPGERSTGPDRDNIQQGDQTASDRGQAGQEHERQGEAPENGPSDGPGGHSDPSSTADHQFTGKE